MTQIDSQVSAEVGTPALKPKKRAAKAAKANVKRRSGAFPAVSFQEALELPIALFQLGQGKPVRRLSLFDHLKKSPESGPSRMLITNSSRYGLTSGSYKAEHLELTPEGLLVVDPETPTEVSFRKKHLLAIDRIPPFKKLFEQYAGNKMPATVVMRDFVKDDTMTDQDAEECVATFIVNLKYVGLLQTISGADRVLTIDHGLEEILRANPGRSRSTGPTETLVVSTGFPKGIVQVKEDYSTTCFYITAIGADGSDTRKHSDLFLNALIEPAVGVFGLKVVRADKIEKTGMISKHIIDHILRCKLVIADLSFHNPNVFYELALRHAARLPTVQLIRARDAIPFDLANYRTIKIDDADLYTFVPKIEAYRAEIQTHVKTALEDPDAVDNPIVAYVSSIKLTF
jgi:hypothetical protein